MKMFAYKGRNPKGELVKGKVEAETSDGVAQQLVGQGIIPIEIQEVTNKKSLQDILNISIFEKAPTRDMLSAFSRQMYTLYKAGVPLSTCTARLAQTNNHPWLRKALIQMTKDIEGGKNLSTSLEQHPKVFSTLFINLVRVGEESGHLEQAFLQLSNYLELEGNTVKQLKAVLRYPIIVITAIVAAFIVITLFVIPAFANLFNNFDAKLPWATQMLISVSTFMRENGLFVLVSVIVLLILLLRYLRSPRGRYHFHRLQLKIPVVGKLLAQILFARFSRTFSMITQTGLSLHKGLELVAQALGNDYIKEKLLTVQQDLSRGESLQVSMKKTGVFPALVLQMLTVGEEAGSLGEMLDQIAEFYEREVEFGLKRLSDALEPLLLVFIGGMVLILALGVFMPMWNMSRLVGH